MRAMHCLGPQSRRLANACSSGSRIFEHYRPRLPHLSIGRYASKWQVQTFPIQDEPEGLG